MGCIGATHSTAQWVVAAVAGLALLGSGVGEAAAAGAAADAYTEQRAVEKAVARAPLLHAVAAKVRAAEGNVGSAGGLPPPMVRLTVSELSYSEHHQKQPTAWVMVEQPLPLGGQVEAPRAVARSQVALAQADAPTQAGEVAYAARLAFGAWRAAVQRRAVLRHHLADAEAIEAVLVRSLGGGRPVSSLRQAQAQADAEGLRVELVALEAGLPALQQQLAQWTGESVEDLGQPSLELPAAPTHTIDWDAHPALLKLASQQRALQARAKAESAAAGWTVTPGLGLMTMDEMPWGLMLSLALRPGDWPDRQRSAAKVAATHGEATALMPMRQDKMLRMRAALAQADGELKQLQVRRQSLVERVIPALRRAVQAALPGLASGAVTVADILEAEHRLRTYDLQQVDLEGAWLQARARRIRLETAEVDGMAVSAGAGGSAMGTSAADTGSQMSH